MRVYEYFEAGLISKDDLVFMPYEIGGITFPGMGIRYLDEQSECIPAVLFPENRVDFKLNNVLTAYAIDYYLADKQCHYFDRDILKDTLIRVRNYFFNLAMLQFVVEDDNKWRLR